VADQRKLRSASEEAVRKPVERIGEQTSRPPCQVRVDSETSEFSGT
jgi:hypothetical protein